MRPKQRGGSRFLTDQRTIKTPDPFSRPLCNREHGGALALIFLREKDPLKAFDTDLVAHALGGGLRPEALPLPEPSMNSEPHAVACLSIAGAIREDAVVGGESAAGHRLSAESVALGRHAGREFCHSRALEWRLPIIEIGVFLKAGLIIDLLLFG